ncbi:MAG: phosphotransferase system enzyme I (PtsP) [Cellvibrionaceae bacterium]|jgi:phosphotransferase system enzyme I (PtsP)
MLDSLRAITQEVNTASSLSTAMEIVVERVRRAMKVKVCSLYLRDDTDRLMLRATRGLNASAVNRISMSHREGLVGYVAKRGEPINLENAEAHSRYLYFPETGEERFRSFLGVPIIHHREVLGVLTVQQSEHRRFDESEEAFLQTLSTQLASVIAHAKAAGGLKQSAKEAKDARFKGMPGASGIAVGTAVVYSPAAELNSVPFQRCKNISNEIQSFHESLDTAKGEIRTLSHRLADRLTQEEQALFDAYGSMLDDLALVKEVVDIIKKGVVASYAWSQVILKHAQTFASMHDPYLSERSADVRDLGRRVLACLQKSSEKREDFPDDTVLLGEELTASVLGEIPKDKLVGLVSVQGSSNSHIAILARAMGIPTVIGAVDLPFTQLDGSKVIVDGYRGNVYVNPSTEALSEFENLVREDEEMSKSYESLRDLPCETLDKHRIPLWVNTGLMADVVRSIERGAEGVGLYRTEVPFLLRDSFPTEAEQTVIYREQLAAFAPSTVTMRTLDVGGDKALSYFPIEEANPFLGWRGIRVTLDHPEIFLAQVRAMIRASEGLNNLRIMLPMISSIPELQEAQSLIYRSYKELVEEKLNVEMPPVGVMIEVPAAVYQAKELAARSDFLSVGSNDLTQYLLAVDRNNARVADLYDSFHPAVLTALQLIVEAAHSQGTPVSICGEMAGDPSAAILLMAMGYDAFSMSSTNLPKVKSVIRSITLEQAKKLLESVMKLNNAESIATHLRSELKGLGIISRPRSLAED